MRYIETPHTPSFPRKRESMPGNSRFTAYGKATSRLHSCQRTQRHFVYRGYQRSDRTHMAAPGTHRRRLHESIPHCHAGLVRTARSEEHTSELQSLMRISYAVFCLQKKYSNIVLYIDIY